MPLSWQQLLEPRRNRHRHQVSLADKRSGSEVKNQAPDLNQVKRMLNLRGCMNEIFARKEEQLEIGQLEHNKPCRLHHLQILIMRMACNLLTKSKSHM